MLRQSLARSALRTGRQSSNAVRTFATSSRRPAEVQLTVGFDRRCVDGVGDESGNMLIVVTAGSALIQACEKAGVVVPR